MNILRGRLTNHYEMATDVQVLTKECFIDIGLDPANLASYKKRLILLLDKIEDTQSETMRSLNQIHECVYYKQIYCLTGTVIGTISSVASMALSPVTSITAITVLTLMPIVIGATGYCATPFPPLDRNGLIETLDILVYHKRVTKMMLRLCEVNVDDEVSDRIVALCDKVASM